MNMTGRNMLHRKRKLGQKTLSLTQRCASQYETQTSPKTPVHEVMLSLDDTILGSVDLAKAEKEYWDSQEKTRNRSQRGPVSNYQPSPLLFGDSCNSEGTQTSPIGASSHIVQNFQGGLSPVQLLSSSNSPCSPEVPANCEKSRGSGMPLDECIDDHMALEISKYDTSFWNDFLASQNEMDLGCDPQVNKAIEPYECHDENSDEKEQDMLLDYSVCVSVNHTLATSGKKKGSESPNDSKTSQSNNVTYSALLQELGISKINWSTDDSVLGMKSVCLSSKLPKADQSVLVDFNQQIRERLIGNARKPVVFRKPLDPIKPTTTTDEKQALNEDYRFFGLPENVYKLIKNFKGIKDFYDWQKSCLSLPAVKNHKNLVYALPTSGGKTLVAEVLILKELLVHKKNVIFILPYVSIVQEKVRSLSPFALELNFFVEEYASNKGVFPPRQRRKKCSVYVATIEKGLGLINSLISEERLSEIGLVVVDELHLIGEGRRGASLETMITKILFSQEAVQTIAMSATIANVDELATFLQAVVFTEDFRPVELKEYVKCENQMFMINRSEGKETTFSKARTLEKTNPADKTDPDLISQLVMEVIPEDSVLVFCRSRKNCENVATMICGEMPKCLTSYRSEEKLALFRALLAEGNGKVCPTLQKTLPFGVAYHHSGLTLAERRLLEEAFLAKTLCVICCTSTLAAGVNLPARRVIIRSPYIGTSFIDLARYKQMIGRAGRTGLGEIGESIVVCSPMDLPKLHDLMVSPMEEVTSRLDENSEGEGLSALIMSSIELKLASSLEELHHLIAKTLLSVQTLKKRINIRNLTEDALQRLIVEGGVDVLDPPQDANCDEDSAFLVELPNGKATKKMYPNSLLSLSKIGRGAVKAGQTLCTAHRLYADLKKAQENLVMTTELHLIYLVTPYNLTESIKPDREAYFKAFTDLKQSDLHTAEIIGLTEATAVRLMRGGAPERTQKDSVERFYLALIIYDLWREMSIWDVSAKFQVSRGQVYSLMSAVPAFTSSVLRFTEDFEEFWCFKRLLSEMSPRLAHFCCLELQPLMELPSVKIGRARQLYRAGYRTILDIAKAEPNDIARSLDHMPRNVARQIVASAKLMLIAKAETLQEDAEMVLEGLGQVNLMQIP